MYFVFRLGDSVTRITKKINKRKPSGPPIVLHTPVQPRMTRFFFSAPLPPTCLSAPNNIHAPEPKARGAWNRIKSSASRPTRTEGLIQGTLMRARACPRLGDADFRAEHIQRFLAVCNNEGRALVLCEGGAICEGKKKERLAFEFLLWLISRCSSVGCTCLMWPGRFGYTCRKVGFFVCLWGCKFWMGETVNFVKKLSKTDMSKKSQCGIINLTLSERQMTNLSHVSHLATHLYTASAQSAILHSVFAPWSILIIFENDIIQVRHFLSKLSGCEYT